jgi:hypothetical protein
MPQTNKRADAPLTAARAEYLLISRVRELPADDLGLFDAFHRCFGHIRTDGVPDAASKGLFPAQLAALLKYVLVYGASHTKRPHDDLAPHIKAWQELWWAVERKHLYAEDPETAATFLVRLIYATLPFGQHADALEAEKTRALALFGPCAAPFGRHIFDLSAAFRAQYQLTPEQLIRVGWACYQAFLDRVDWTKENLEFRVPLALKPFVPRTLEVLAASRNHFRNAYRRVRAQEGLQTPYEGNPLLWKPIIAAGGRYYAPYPELVAYAVTRGVFFRSGHRWGSPFREAFDAWFAAYVGDLLKGHIHGGAVIGAAEEQALGYTGQNVDWTVLLGTTGLLLACKSSALFTQGKILATPQAIREDLATNLVKAGKGLFQLHEKLRAIRHGALPATLQKRYATITTWYPVFIVYDHIEQANARPVLRHFLDAALHQAGVADLQYQIWHIQELENFFQLVPEAELIARLRGKWEHPHMCEWDLNAYLHALFGLDKLRSALCVPERDAPAYKTLARWSE